LFNDWVKNIVLQDKDIIKYFRRSDIFNFGGLHT